MGLPEKGKFEAFIPIIKKGGYREFQLFDLSKDPQSKNGHLRAVSGENRGTGKETVENQRQHHGRWP